MGGIQSYLWELWRRLPPPEVTVVTTPSQGAVAFDSAQPFPVVRTRQRLLLPTPGLARLTRALADEVNASLVVLDPALPLGLLGPSLGRPYVVVLHGAEVTVPGRLPGATALLGRVLRGASHVIAAGRYPAAEAERVARQPLPLTVVPPGVDTATYRPLPAAERRRVRAELGLPVPGRLVVGVSRLVPRKGMDTLVRAAARLAPLRPDLTVAIAGDGRDRSRLARLIRRTGAPVRLLGAQPSDVLPRLYGCADAFAMLCRTRWVGLEQEGFGIVFLEAAASGVPAVAGDSGGAGEAVLHGETGLVVGRPGDVAAAASALAELLDDPRRRASMGDAARRHAVSEYGYERLAARVHSTLAAVGSSQRAPVRPAGGDRSRAGSRLPPGLLDRYGRVHRRGGDGGGVAGPPR
ncbi:MAG: glycosyltransferase family 4 protein [Acidimicrobiales bacterium]